MFSMLKHLLIIGFLSIALSINAQKVLRGKLVASDSKKPVAAASVFLSNTSIGTVSSEDGSFIINSFPEGRYDLVVSILGYETKTIPLNSSTIPGFLEIILTPKVKELDEVIVEPYEKNGWEKWGFYGSAYGQLYRSLINGKSENEANTSFDDKISGMLVNLNVGMTF